MPGESLLWGHCHQRATGGMAAEQSVLEQMGQSVRNLQGGCCGLAGSWGFEEGKYGISMDCGEQALLPAVRNADPGTLVVADGFSCKTQIADADTGRHAMHIAEVMKLARDGDHPGQLPQPSAMRRAGRLAAVALPGLAAAGAAVAAIARRRLSHSRVSSAAETVAGLLRKMSGTCPAN